MASRSEARRRKTGIEPTSAHAAPAAPPRAKVLALLALILGAVYAPTLRYGLVWDDPISIYRWLRALRPWTRVFLPPPAIPQFPPDYYRPLQLLSYHIDAWIGGGAAWAFHVTSVLLHIAATLLVYRTGLSLWRACGPAHQASLAAALLFAVHPIHTESVAWIAARPDPMVAVFLLSALLVLGSDRFRPVARTVAAGALMLAALLSKERGACALLLAPLWAWATNGPKEGQPARSTVSTAWITVASILAGGTYLILRHLGLAHYEATGFQIPPQPLYSLVSSAGWYTAKLFWPFPQNAFVDEIPRSPLFFATGTLATLASLAIVFSARGRLTRAHLCCVVWYWATLAPALLLLAKPPTAPVAERYLYLPSIAFAWFLGHGLARLRARLQGERTKQVATLFAGCAFAALASATLVRNEVWRNDLRLWADTAGKTKSDGMPLRNWAAALLQAGELERAETLLHQALTRHNTPAGLSNIHSNLGTIAMYRRQWELAREHYQKAYDIVPSGDMAYNLGVVFLHSSEEVAQEQRRTKLLEAKRWFAQAVASSPHDPDPHLGYGQVLLLLGERDLARQHFQRAFQLGLPPDRAEQARALLERGSP